MAEVYRYAAFISYSSKDAAFAKKLHQALERYGIPTSLGQFDLIGQGKKNRIYPVFRDREELASGDLGEAIGAALQASSALIIVCSPNAAASPWVNKEIESFLALGRRNRIFAIIHPDAPLADDQGRDATAACFPPAFHGDGLEGGLEPIAGDARKGRDGFRNAWLKVVAGLIGVNAGVLQDRDKKRRLAQRLQIGAGVGVAALALAFAGAALDARLWRSELTQAAIAAIGEGLPADAAPFALGGAGAAWSLLPLRDSDADRVAIQSNAARLIVDLGPLQNSFFLRDGAALFFHRADAPGTAALLDLKTGAKTELGALGPLKELLLARNGATVFLQRADAQETAAALDLKTGAKVELGALGPLWYYELTGDGATLVIQRDDPQKTVALIDLKSSAKTELGPLSPLPGFELAADASVLAIRRADARESVAVIDLKTGAKTELGAFGQIQRIDFAANGAKLIVSRRDSGGAATIVDVKTRARTQLGALKDYAAVGDDTIIFRRDDAQETSAAFDLKTGVTTELGSLLSAPPPMGGQNGKLLILRDTGDESGADINAAVIDLKTGTTTELGPLRDYAEDANSAAILNGVVATTGAALIVRRADTQETSALLDTKTGATTELGVLGPLQRFALADDRSLLVFQRDDAQGTAATINLKTMAKTELGGLGPVQGFTIAANGASLFLRRADTQGTAAIRDLNTGAEIELGPLLGQEISGSVILITRNGFQKSVQGSALIDLSRPVETARKDGAALTVAACDANGHALRPFPPTVRDATRNPAISATLRGRPWNPCDWRGFGAIFPDPVRGDGWFEGPRQWARLMSVRHFGAKDWACEETLVNASQKQKDDRAAMCSLYGPDAPELLKTPAIDG